MKKTAALIEKLTRLATGEALPASSLKGDWFEQMREDGILVPVTHGSRYSLRVSDIGQYRHYIASQFDIRDLEQTRDILLSDSSDRASQVAATGDSKFLSRRTFEGFLVNSYQPIDAILGGNPLTIFPPNGTFVFIADYHHFSIPGDVVIVGVENAENFRYVARQKSLFKEYGKVLFVSRYPQNQSKDLLQWLSSIPNRYIHFGDFDLAGIHIFLTEFYPHLGERSSYLIPSDIEQRLTGGSQKRYDGQYAKFHKLSCEIPALQRLIDLIHHYHKGYDQEGYIELEPSNK